MFKEFVQCFIRGERNERRVLRKALFFIRPNRNRSSEKRGKNQWRGESTNSDIFLPKNNAPKRRGKKTEPAKGNGKTNLPGGGNY
ncbi:MAG: hypothetical protein D6714_21630 [Bacteroidetes bacterium]|nr:MAG: hypothetical protein D6714_21630 [Bacteroidota bacterium]